MSNTPPTNVKGNSDEWLWRRVLPSLLLVAFVVAAYSNSFDGAFLFDDIYHIVENERIRQLWPPWNLLAVERPVVELSLAVNYALGGLKPWGYHAFNLVVHILAALTLYGVLSRTIVVYQSRGRKPTDISLVTGLAPGALFSFVIALLWAVHPLQTQSVTYVIQRGESLMGLFYLLTLYCAIRGLHTSRRLGWYGAAIVACALGMASKAVMVTAPVMVFIYDLVFLRNGTSKRRWVLYAGLTATWGVLWTCGVTEEVLDPEVQRSHVGFGYHGITPLEYAATQPGAILKYLRLSFWPVGLCLDYDWPVARTAMVIIPSALVLLLMLGATAWGLVRRSWLGFAGAWFFVILAPTSSFIPIKDLAFEHRMYLPLAAVIVVVVLGVKTLVHRTLTPTLSLEGRGSFWKPRIQYIEWPLNASVLVVAALLLGYFTYQRNKDYHSDLVMWTDVAAKRPDNARARVAVGNALLARNRVDEAIAAYREAVAIRPDFADGQCALGMGLARKGALDEAVTAYRESLRLDPNLAKAHYNLGNALSRQGRIDESIRSFRESLRIRPRFADAHCNLGNALAAQGQLDEAIAEYREAIRIKPGLANAHKGLGDVLVRLGRADEGIAAFQEAIRIQPDYANAHANLAAAHFDRGEYEEAAKHAREALRIDPAHAAAKETLNATQAAISARGRP